MPLLPAFSGGWVDSMPLDAVVGDHGPGIMPGWTWAVAPDVQSPEKRWAALKAEKVLAMKERMFHPQLRDDKIAGRHIREFVLQGLVIILFARREAAWQNSVAGTLDRCGRTIERAVFWFKYNPILSLGNKTLIQVEPLELIQ